MRGNLTYILLSFLALSSFNVWADQNDNTDHAQAQAVPVIRPSAKLTRRASLLKKEKLTLEERKELSEIHALLFPGQRSIDPPIQMDVMRMQAKSSDALSLPELPKGPVDLEEETDPFFKEIMGKVGPIFESEGEIAVGKLLAYNANFDLGQSNYSGIEWQKPMGGVTMYVDRAVVPEAFDENSWVVTDSAVLVVEAQSFLKLLSDNELIEPLNDSQLGAYAGLSFSRTYTFQHHADSFAQGLKSEFQYLFLPFIFMRANHLADLPRPSKISRLDSFVVAAGGAVYSPIYYGLSAKAGALFEYNHLSQLTVEASQIESGIKVSLAKSNSLTAHVKAQIMADLYSILQLTLFAFDAQAEWGKTQETSLMFSDAEIAEFKKKEGEDFKELKSFLSGKSFELGTLANNVLSHNAQEHGTTSLDVEALFWGHKGNHELSQIELIKDDISQFYVKVIDNKFDYFQKWWAKLLGDALKSIIGSSFLGNQYFTFHKQSYSLEYKREESGHDPESINVEELSLQFSESYYLANTIGIFNEGPKNKFLQKLSNFSGPDPLAIEKIAKEELIGPLTLETSLKVQSSGLLYFSNLDEDQYTLQTIKVCETKRPEFWMDHEQREKGLSHWQIGKREICMKKMINSFRFYQSEYQRLGRIGLKALRNWVALSSQYAKTPEKLLGFFKNLDDDTSHGGLFAGSLQARDGKKGPMYTTFFKEGKMDDRGVLAEALLLPGLPYPINQQ